MSESRGTLRSLPVRSSRELPRENAEGETVYGPARFDRGNLVAAQGRALRRAQGAVLVLSLLAAVLVAALLRESGRSRIVPYVVQVDRHGEALAVGPAREMADPDRRMLMHALTLWVVHARTVTTDRELERRELEGAYAYSSGRAVALLNDGYQARSPFRRAAEETVTVRLESLLALDPSARRFRLQWTETVRSPGGAFLREELWQALVTVEVHPPGDVDQVLENPLGIRVTDFDWQRLSSSTERSGKSTAERARSPEP